MLTIKGPAQRLCEGIRRRDFLKIGTLGALGLSLADMQRAAARQAQSGANFGRARRCVLLFLTGGPPQHETFDPKPEAPAEYRGALRPIASRLTGISIGELFPRLAQQLDRCCLIRSVTHGDRVHTSAGYTMLTGNYHPQANARSASDIRPGPHDHPHLGALLAQTRSADGIPAFAALPEVIRDAGVNTYPGLDGGLLGKQFAPFRIEAEANKTAFQVPEIFLPDGITAERLEDRRVLRDRLDRRLAAADLDGLYHQAFRLLRAASLRQAFDLAQEPERTRDRYGRHLFGQGCLLARRLLEAGVSLVSVYWHYEGPDDSPVWDTHQNNFAHMRNRLGPPTDEAVAALLQDLADRGLLDETLLVCMGEFGRTPKVNDHAGRDHWPSVMSVLMAGGGIRRGIVYGASDRTGAFPKEQPVTPPDLAATMLHCLGVPPDLEIRDRTDRPLAACQGKPVAGLLA